MTAVQITPAIAAWDNAPTIGPRGTLILIPGRGEHPALYERFGTRLAFDGYRVRAVADPTADEHATEAQVAQLLADNSLSAPRVLVGSDAGALFAVALVAARRVEVDGLVLAGLPVSSAGPGQPGQPDVTEADWDQELVLRTACPTHQARLRADPDVRHGALAEELPPQWLKRADLKDVAAPILGIHGADDSVSPLTAVRGRYAAAPAAELVSIVAGKHDALNDATHRTVAATIVLFLERLRLGSTRPVIAHSELSDGAP